MQIYAEHRFIMLVVGIETFHRKKHGSGESIETLKRIERILNTISDRKDKKWLAGRLRYAAEPNLEQRIVQTLAALPIDLDAKRLRRFAKVCAEYRNDLSHFGDRRDQSQTYSEFIVELSYKAGALAYLSHALILQEIGLNPDIVRWWFNDSFHSYRIKFALAKAGLIDNPMSPGAH